MKKPLCLIRGRPGTPKNVFMHHNPTNKVLKGPRAPLTAKAFRSFTHSSEIQILY